MVVTLVESLDLPALEPYRTLRSKTARWQAGYFVAEGEKVVRRLLAGDHAVVSLLLSERWFEALRPVLAGDRCADVEVFIAPEKELDSITGIKLHQRIMAIGRVPESPGLSGLGSTAGDAGIHVALEGIADAENMGMIVRNCAAFGAGSLITGRDSCNPYLRRSVRVSMGALFSLRSCRVPDVLETLSGLKSCYGWRIVGTAPQGGAHNPISALPPEHNRPDCLLFGSEGRGLSDRALACCDAVFSIPMRGGIDSLNVANAVAVALYEFSNRRG